MLVEADTAVLLVLRKVFSRLVKGLDFAMLALVQYDSLSTRSKHYGVQRLLA